MFRRLIQYFLLAALLVLTKQTYSQSNIPKLSFDELSSYLHQDNDTTYVVNFWATWCGPCVKELPHFEELNQSMADKKVKVILVSLDFPQHFESALLPFVKRKDLKSKVLFLNDGKANVWIPKVDPEWTGAIPATLIYNSKKRKFYEQSFTKKELQEAVKTMVND